MAMTMNDIIATQIVDEVKITEIPGISKFKDSEGNIVPWRVKAISTTDFLRIQQDNTKKVHISPGKVANRLDEKSLTSDLMIESIEFPDFKNTEWLKANSCIDPQDLLFKVLSKFSDFERISKAVVVASGISTNQEQVIAEVKN